MDSAELPMLRSEEPVYEYACHEGNYAMTGILAGARAAEKDARSRRKAGFEVNDNSETHLPQRGEVEAP